jgi:hypothetical protein
MVVIASTMVCWIFQLNTAASIFASLHDRLFTDKTLAICNPPLQ